MINSFVAFAGRPWDMSEATHPSRFVGEFDSFEHALDAYPSVNFVELPTRSGCRRWRGWGPQTGFIVQVEQVTAERQLWREIA